MYAKYTLRILLSAVFSALMITQVQAAAFPTVACSADLVSRYSCNVCFDGGSLYAGRGGTTLDDVVFNNGSQINIYRRDENSNGAALYNTYGVGIVAYTTPAWEFVADFLKCTDSSGNKAWCTNGGQPAYTYQMPGESALWVRTVDRQGLSVISVDPLQVNASNRANIRSKNFTAVYRIHTRYYNSSFQPTGEGDHVECASVGARSCGDGVVDSGDGESCDDGANNGQPGRCNTTCTGVPPDTRFDLAIFKFVNSNQADTAATAERIVAGSAFQYMFQVDNRWPAAANGTTTVRDTSIPAGVTLTTTPSGSGWNCRLITGGFECTRTDTLAAGSRFPDIVAPALLSASAAAGQTLTNTARVLNPGQIDDATNGGNNTNPANIITDSVPPTPSCNSVVVTPTIVRVPGGASVSCNTSNVPPTSQVRIDCGNGTTINASAGTCNYTVADPNPTVRCNIVASDNSIITSPQCAAVVDTRPQSACQSITATPGSSTAGSLTSTVTCTALNPDPTAVYAVDCGNGGGFNTPSTARSRSCTYGVGNFTARCQVRNAPGGAVLPDASFNSCALIVPVSETPRFNVALEKSVSNSISGPWFEADTSANALTITTPPSPVSSEAGVSGSRFFYAFVVGNGGPSPTSGVIRIVDDSFWPPSPASAEAGFRQPIRFDSVAVANGWTCDQNLLRQSRVNCTRSDILPAGQQYPQLILIAQFVDSTPNVVRRNDACVVAPGETDVTPSDNCDPAHVRVNPIATPFELSLKKFVGTGATIADAQDTASAVTVTKGVNYNYTIRVTNLGPSTVTGTTTVVDTLPTGVTLVGVTGAFWTCSLVGTNGFTCSNPFAAPSGAVLSDLIVTANIPTTTADGVYLNTATVSNPNERNSPLDNTDPANVRVGSTTNACTPGAFPANTALTATTPGLCLTDVPVTTFNDLSSGNNASYTWACGGSTVGGACASSFCSGNCGGGGGGTPKCIAARFPDGTSDGARSRTISITEPNRDVRVVCEGEYVAAPATIRCGNGTTVTATDTSSFTAIIANGSSAVAVAGTCSYQNAGEYTVSCEFPAQTTTNPLCGGLVAKKNGGGGGCVSNCGGGNPRCGDGVIQRPNPQGVFEECDDGNTNNNDSCTNACRIQTSPPTCTAPFGCIFTNPGENGTITPFILQRSGGTPVSPIDGFPFTNPGAGEINLFNYRTIIGQSVPVFATNDTIKFRPAPPHTTTAKPLILEEGSIYCIGNNPDADFTHTPITGTDLCRTLDETYAFPVGATVKVPVWGSYTQGTPPGPVRVLSGIVSYSDCTRGSPNPRCAGINFVDSIDLFRGSDLQGFRGKDLSNIANVQFDTAGKYGYTNYLKMNGNRSQYVYTAGGVSAYPRFSVTMRFLEQPIAVRVAKSAVANSAGGNAYVGTDVGSDLSRVADLFLPVVARNWNANATSASSANAISSTTRTNAGTLTGAMTIDRLIPASAKNAATDKTVNSIAQINALTSLPGNGNVLIAKNLTIDELSSANALTLDGVKTVVVFGNLTIKSDLINGANSSWAFIVQGNIVIDPSVSRLAGVYVAIPSGTVGGEITGSSSTIRQLLIDGTLYGKLSDIITDRTYVFANNYSQIVSAGTVINYSNRALLLPPPLLVNLLKQYTFDRK